MEYSWGILFAGTLGPGRHAFFSSSSSLLPKLEHFLEEGLADVRSTSSFLELWLLPPAWSDRVEGKRPGRITVKAPRFARLPEEV